MNDSESATSRTMIDDVVKEYIVCSCINYKGIKVSGRRMNDCITTIRGFESQPDINEVFDNQGFITSSGRFVTREEAWVIAKENNQIKYEIIKDFGEMKPFLMSINLFKD